MGNYRYPKSVKLVIALLGESPQLIEQCIDQLQSIYGPIDDQMDTIPFEYTNYYMDEIGQKPFRSLISFKDLIKREYLVDIKIQTNEKELADFNGLRRVNIDPGYLTLGQFFLATTKDQRQRVYIRDGIFMDPTLYFKDKEYHYYDWTYHDYRSKEYHEFLKRVRKTYHQQLKSL